MKGVMFNVTQCTEKQDDSHTKKVQVRTYLPSQTTNETEVKAKLSSSRSNCFLEWEHQGMIWLKNKEIKCDYKNKAKHQT